MDIIDALFGSQNFPDGDDNGPDWFVLDHNDHQTLLIDLTSVPVVTPCAPNPSFPSTVAPIQPNPISFTPNLSFPSTVSPIQLNSVICEAMRILKHSEEQRAKWRAQKAAKKVISPKHSGVRK